MVLRYEVDQAEAFRNGVNVEKSTNHLNINPAEITQEERNLIADRLDGIDVCRLEIDGNGKITRATMWHLEGNQDELNPYQERANRGQRIVAKAPTFQALMEAIRKNQIEVEIELAKKLSSAR